MKTIMENNHIKRIEFCCESLAEYALSKDINNPIRIDHHCGSTSIGVFTLNYCPFCGSVVFVKVQKEQMTQEEYEKWRKGTKT